MKKKLNSFSEENIQKLAHIIENIHQQIHAIAQSIIIIGTAKSGRTQFLNYVAGEALVAKKMGKINADIMIDTKEPVTERQIGNASYSDIALPHSWQNEAGTTYWDFPDFSNNTGAMQTIVNAIYLHKIFENSKEVKMVVVSDALTLSENTAVFEALLCSLSQLIPNFAAYQNSTTLLITKILRQEDILNQVKKDLNEIYIKENEKLDKDTKQIFKFFFQDTNNIAFFYQPERLGDITLENKEEILAIVNKTSFISTNETTINVTIPAESIACATKLCAQITGLIAIHVDNLLANVIEKCKNLIKQERFDDLSRYLNHFKPLLCCNFSEIEALQALHKDSLNQLAEQEQQINFYAISNLFSYYLWLNHIIRSQEAFSKEPQPELLLSGVNVLNAKVKEAFAVIGGEVEAALSEKMLASDTIIQSQQPRIEKSERFAESDNPSVVSLTEAQLERLLDNINTLESQQKEKYRIRSLVANNTRLFASRTSGQNLDSMPISVVEQDDGIALDEWEPKQEILAKNNRCLIS